MVSVIIVSAGKGKRFNKPVLKPYFPLGNKPIIVHTILAFSVLSLIDEIILVVPPQEKERTKKLLGEWAVKIDKLVSGGVKRQDSVCSGLKEISAKAEIVLVHDGGRPLIKKGLIARVINGVKSFEAVIPAIRCEDTIKEIETNKKVVKTLNRRLLWAVQTPQGFKKDILLSAYEKAKTSGFYGTDDAELVERLGWKVSMVDGDKENIKITTPVDLVVAEALLKQRNNYTDLS